ncbi:hypothetical protein GCK72_019905 [Caenorhabditis remanei]|uniref:Uncharacterized protein n=1 Tax=Caenorhabditis remanei TaxID=31234 RepID=A0A6A5GG14_CAERE|nr:hypothetical protein GCK72_019905 [Caenorhabditis remanei]KAF1753349.1 hypothetical protein GCK72_019905 [Caenorhabditis remanei]
MTRKSTIQTCQVCGDISRTTHFGAVSCRACAEFFRRKVVSNDKLVKRCSGKCQLNRRSRKTCKSCRFERCLEIGMLKTVVTSNTSLKTDDCSTEELNSILIGLRNRYSQLEDDRRRVFGRQSYQQSRYSSYDETGEVIAKDMELISKHIISFFQARQSVHKCQEHILADNFVIPFILLETSFRSIGVQSLILPTGSVVDAAQLDKFYLDWECDEQPQRNTILMLQPYWTTSFRLLKDPMNRIKLDLAETLLLSALIYWDFGIVNQSEECIEKCLQMRNVINWELVNYEKFKYGIEDHSLRIMEVMSYLQGVQKASTAIKDGGHVAKIYKLKGKESPLYGIADD